MSAPRVLVTLETDRAHYRLDSWNVRVTPFDELTDGGPYWLYAHSEIYRYESLSTSGRIEYVSRTIELTDVEWRENK